VFSGKGRLVDACVHIERAKSYAVNNAYSLGRLMELQAGVWYNQFRFEEAKPEALRAVEVFERLGAAQDVERCNKLLRDILQKLNDLFISDESGLNDELLETLLLLAHIYFLL